MGRDQLVALRAHVDLLLGSDKPQEDDKELIAVLTVLSHFYSKVGLPLVKRHRSYKSIKAGAKTLISFAEEFWPTASRLSAQARLVVLVSVLRDHLRQQRGWEQGPPPLINVLHSLGRVREAVESQLPGYLESGLLRWIAEPRKELRWNENSSTSRLSS